MSLFAELKRRNVIRAATAYVVSAWVIVQVAETIFPFFGFSDTAIRNVIILLAIGFIPAIVLASVLQFTPEGLRRDTGEFGQLTPKTRKRRWPLVAGALVLLSAAVYTFKSFTMPIFAQGSITDLFELEINGDVQYLLVRGVDSKQPVMLFVHGGPGMPAMFLAHEFQRDLEKEFVVVHWDQRASGKSFKGTADQEQLSTSLLLGDMDVVVDYLRGSLDADRLWIVGHSHGSYLGALYTRRHPEKVCAFVGTGQVADESGSGRTRTVQEEFLRRRLEELGLDSDTVIDDSNLEELLFLTGSELYGETSFSPLLMSGLMATEYSLFDALNVASGSSFSSRSMVYDMPRDLLTSEWQFDVPVAMIMGRQDLVTPTQLSREYYERIEAPTKAWFVFEETSHFPHFEQPLKFTKTLAELKSRWRDCPD